MGTIVQMFVTFMSDEDSPIHKFMPFFHFGKIIVNALNSLLILIASILPFMLPAILILLVSTFNPFKKEAEDYFKMYKTEVEINKEATFNASASTYTINERLDTIELNDYTYITDDMLIAIDNARFDGEYTKTSSKLIKKTVSDMISATSEIVYIDDIRQKKIPVTKPDGEYILVHNTGTNSDIPLLGVLQSEFPDGVKIEENDITYFSYEEKVQLKKGILSFNSTSFEETIKNLGFDEEKQALAITYYNVLGSQIVEFEGKQGNFIILPDNNKFVLPIGLDYPLVDASYIRITSGFGYREFMYQGKLIKGDHNGIDIGLPVGINIVASDDGVVSKVGYISGSYGNWVEVKHANGYVTRYAHLSRYLVNEGDELKRGESLGISGNTGRSTGAHLHFEIRQNGIVMNPVPFLNIEPEESE